VLYAFGSAGFAGATAILAKIGIRQTNSNLATALRTIVVLAAAWGMACLVGSAGQVARLDARTWLFLVLSGLATGASWLCHFRALQLGEVNKVAPVDRSSLVLTVLFAVVFLGETDNLAATLGGGVLIGLGTAFMVGRMSSRPASLGRKGDRPSPGRTVTTSAPVTRDGDRPSPGPTVMTSAPGGRGGDRPSPGPTVMTSAPGGRGGDQHPHDSDWFLYAAGSAVFAALTTILGKVGIAGVESNLGTAIRTAVVLVMAWLVVGVTRTTSTLRSVPRRDLAFILLSGLATAGSWLCYYKALQQGPASVVAPIDKLSILVTVGFSWWVLHEKITRWALVGLGLITVGTLTMLLR